jgi:hypothetical protein
MIEILKKIDDDISADYNFQYTNGLITISHDDQMILPISYDELIYQVKGNN